MKKTISLIILFCLALTIPALAQDDINSVGNMSYGDVVEDTLTEVAFFDWWHIQVGAGDVVYVEMIAADGLVPLVGLLDSGGNLVARSDGERIAEINGVADLQYVAEIDGRYTIVATRDGNENGTSTGSYTLAVSLMNPDTERPDLYQDVEFRCEDFIVTTAATIIFDEDAEQIEFFRVSVYGLDGFQPAIRAHTETNDFTYCSHDTLDMGGDSFTLPGEETLPLPDVEDDVNLDQAARLNLRSTGIHFGPITYTIGSEDGSPGRYMAVIEGFSISPSSDRDYLTVQLGPLARETEMLLYMVGAENTRLDPLLRQIFEDNPEIICDDAGRRDCANVPSITGAGATITSGDGVRVIGDRLDAGLLLNPGNPDLMILEMTSRGGETHGEYALIIIGELPPRDVGEGE